MFNPPHCPYRHCAHHLPPADERWFVRFGHWLLTFGYFVPGVRHVTAIAAGSAPISYGAFARAAYPGAVLWCCVFVGVGYYAGDKWQQVAILVHGHLRVAASVLVLAGGAALLGRWVWTARHTT